MLSPPTLPTLLPHILKTLSTSQPTDPIQACPPSALSLLPTRPEALIKLAHAKIHSFPFSQVPVCWRRLFTDASIAVAVGVIQRGIREGGDANGEHGGNGADQDGGGGGGGGGFEGLGGGVDGCGEGEDWVQEAVRLLDMAVIMAGAPKRGETVEELIGVLQDWVERRDGEGEPRRKKVKREEDEEDVFPRTQGRNVPDIQKPIRRRSSLSMEEFERLLPKASPLVIQGALAHWPACDGRTWRSPNYLLRKTFGGRRLIPVETGRSYTDVGWGQSILRFKDFMDRYLLPPAKEQNRDGQGLGYLAQHDLFAQIPSLRNDISIPDYCFTNPPPPSSGTLLSLKEAPAKLEEPLLNAWFGPAGTVSPLHTDPYHNILCQVVGKKYVRLYNPSESHKLYPRGVDDGGVDMSNTSKVDVEGDESERDKEFPLFKTAEYVETILAEGECLYIPVGWWHYVRSLTVSFSVSFWWN